MNHKWITPEIAGGAEVPFETVCIYYGACYEQAKNTICPNNNIKEPKVIG